ncbi:(Fe-S)-binding protein [Geoalkalibacter halelectricus]|uniref:Glycolate oxidase iron-sulfur subunit n=1 Tax=Geoalkalibacter halelectricus TaxID=2847045 RepID=A0ABY5ZLP4_9BACT|nr:(Fe-S)-binding protein [Geoalkalibacter halelectricus]MDO3378605.1 (Fe-S)-binding protein [Geoalkalibacter halelectricus]UWZ80082.1 (Fe-S)-binding protein [Geoalkalibacter halelectricus]
MSHTEPLGNFKSEDAPHYDDVLQCMRCGFCLPTCPTYALTGRERSSPRGRVALARAVAEKKLEFTPAIKEEAFFCLDCRACTSACPSGVRAGEVMEVCRSQAHAFYPLGKMGKAFREFILQKMVPSPDLLETSMLPTRLYQRLGIQWLVRHLKVLKLGPEWMEKAEGMLPRLEKPLRPQLPLLTPARGEKRGKVGFFLGCVMTLMYPNVSRNTVRVLSHQGFEVVTPRETKCCGAPHLSEGDRETARQLALFNLDLFLAQDVDYIVTDCAGCGAALKEYEELLEERAEHDRLARFRSKIRDVSEFLMEVGLRTEGLQEITASVTYHEPCHLCHAQGISAQPRRIIRQIPGVELREMAEASWCCGSAATWGLKYAEDSRKVLDRKLENVKASGAEILVTANPGCQLQLAWGVREASLPQDVLHLMELLGRALPPD